jgi:hypothetical protein
VDPLDMILAHELAHIRRRDYLVNLIQCVLDSILFFNPFFRWLSAGVREEREYCCDDEAAQASGNGQTMALALAQLRLMAAGMPLTLQAAPKQRTFYRRLDRLIGPVKRPILSIRAVLSWIALVSVIGLGLARCQRSVVSQVTLPADWQSLRQQLWDNQAGYNERIYYYEQSGIDHDLFVVSEVGRSPKPLYGYIDGVLLSPGDFAKVAVQLKKPQTVYLLSVKGNVIRGASAEAPAAADSVAQVKAAMKEYFRAVKIIPLEIRQHDLLTKIVGNRTYTAEDRAEMAALIKDKHQIVITGR